LTRARPLLILALLAVSACTAPPGPQGKEADVFAVAPAAGYTQSMPSTTINENDVAIPLLHNLSSNSVRLRWVRLTGVPKAVRVDSVVAYKYGQVGAIALSQGNLLTGPCRQAMTPYPVPDVAAAPHSDSDWYVMIGFTITRPGRYHIQTTQIGYTTGGHNGWQYQNLDTIITVSKARPGAKPIPGQC
jgi:hypothetical protein